MVTHKLVWIWIMEQEVDALLRMEAIERDWILQSIIHRSEEGWGVG